MKTVLAYRRDPLPGRRRRHRRIARGPSLLDRVLAADVLLAILGAALCMDMAVNGHLNNLMLLVAISVIGFIGSVTVARFVADRREQHMSPDASA